MTAEEKREWHQKAVTIMKEVLTKNVGWPQCSDEQIMEQLGPMWEALVAAKLVLKVLLNAISLKLLNENTWKLILDR